MTSQKIRLVVYIKTMQLFFYLPTFNASRMRHLLYLMFRCNVDVMESLELGGVFWELNTA